MPKEIDTDRVSQILQAMAMDRILELVAEDITKFNTASASAENAKHHAGKGLLDRCCGCDRDSRGVDNDLENESDTHDDEEDEERALCCAYPAEDEEDEE